MNLLISFLMLTAGVAPSAPCHVPGLATEVICGELVVPRGPAPDSGTLTLKYTIVQATPGQPSADAVLVLAGGPGQGIRRFTDSITGVLAQTRNRRDLVFVDQRGTGDSEPLDCPALPPTEASTESVRACLAQMPDDLENFSHAMTIADFERLRTALGYHQWNLFGGSMGTRVAQLYMRAYPHAIRAAVLDGVAPLGMVVGASMGRDAQPALDAMFARCASQPDCAAAFPGGAAQFDALLERLAHEPATVSLPHPVTGAPITRTVDRDGLAVLVRGLLYGESMQRVLPYMLGRAADGDFVPLLALQETFYEQYTEMMAVGLTANILCSEDIGRHGAAAVPDEEAASFIGRAQADFWLEVCAVWPRYAVPADFDTPLVSDIPTLLVSGELDPVTPPRYGEQLAETLTNARHLIVPGGDHTVAFRGSRCLNPILNAFLDDPDPAALDVSCLERQRAGAAFTRATGFQQEESR